MILGACGGGEGPAIANTPPPTSIAGPVETTRAASPADPVAGSTTTSTTGATTTSVTTQPVGDGGSSPATWSFEIIDRYPHDPTAFTQGLLVRGETVYESTGLYGESSVRAVERATGATIAQTALEDDLFGEGLELVDDRLIQLTWQEETALVWDAATLTQVGEFDYTGEGWGLCYDGERLVMSDGTPELDLRSPEDFSVLSTVTVIWDGSPVPFLNELECVDGLVYANVWQSNLIVVIEPDTGRVVAVIDATPLVVDVGLEDESRAVLNGIAYDATTGSFLLTGKLWPTMFEVRIVESSP